MQDREVMLGITCPQCKTRNLLLVKDFEGKELIPFQCVECGFEKEFRHPDDTGEVRKESDTGLTGTREPGE